MPTQTLPASTYISFEFDFRRKRGSVKFYIESEIPIDTHIVDGNGHHEFMSANPFDSYGGFINRVEHQQELRVPYQDMWYLIIQNNNPGPTAVHYEVYE